MEGPYASEKVESDHDDEFMEIVKATQYKSGSRRASQSTVTTTSVRMGGRVARLRQSLRPRKPLRKIANIFEHPGCLFPPDAV